MANKVQINNLRQPVRVFTSHEHLTPPIEAVEENQVALERLDELWDAEQGTPEGDEFD